MYSTIIRWQPYTGIQESANYNRTGSFKSPIMASKFQEFVDAGLVSNDAGPNCHIIEIDNSIEVRNATWQTQAAAQEWVDFIKDKQAIISIKITNDDDNTVLFSFP